MTISEIQKRLDEIGDYIPWAFWQVAGCAFVLSVVLGFLLNSAEVGALIFTAAFIAWYSIETSKLVKETKIANQLSSKMRQEMIIATQLSIQPGLILEYQREDREWSFKLKNIGKGGAINIKIESNRPEYSFELDGLNAMKDGDENLVTLRKERRYLTIEEWRSLESNPIIATISFERTKKYRRRSTTKIEVQKPPMTKILETNWVPS